MDEDDLLRTIAARAGVLLIGEPPLIEWRDAAALIDVIDAAGATILGIDGFRRVGNHIAPVMAMIADFSQATSSGESVEAARRFFVTIGDAPDHLFEFVLKD